MNRLLHPWQALKLPAFITRKTKDTLIANTDMGLVGELLLADIETHGNAVRATRHPVFDPRVLIDNLAQFAELSSCIVREMEIRRDGKWGKRLLADRAAVAEAMENIASATAARSASRRLPHLPSRRISISLTMSSTINEMGEMIDQHLRIENRMARRANRIAMEFDIGEQQFADQSHIGVADQRVLGLARDQQRQFQRFQGCAKPVHRNAT